MIKDAKKLNKAHAPNSQSHRRWSGKIELNIFVKLIYQSEICMSI